MNKNKESSPIQFFVILVLAVITIETSIMYLLYFINLTPDIELLIDVAILVVVLLPFLYFFSFRPLRRYINKFKEEERALAATSAYYRSLAENLPLRLFLKDRDSVYRYCNKNYADDLGVTSDEVKGKTDFDFYAKDLAEKYRKDDKEVIESGRERDLDEQYTKDGKGAWVHTVKLPYKNSQGEITGILGVFWDITESKNASDKLKDQIQKMELLNKLAVGRELKMIELKKELEETRKKQ